MSDRSDKLWEAYQAAQVKFDYFFCTVMGAVFTYIIHDYTPHKFTEWRSALEPLALVFLAVGFFVGLKRIEASVGVLKTNHSSMHDFDLSAKMLGMLHEGLSSYRINTGEVLTHQQLEKRREQVIREQQAATDAGVIYKAKAYRYYKARNALLLLGFGTIFLAKVTQPYAIDSAPPTPPIYTIQITNTVPQSVPAVAGQTNKP